MTIRDDLKTKFITTYKITQTDYDSWLDGTYFKTDSVSADWSNISNSPITFSNNTVDFGGKYISNVSKISMAVSGDGVLNEGDISWDSINHCPMYRPNQSGVNIQIGQESVVLVYNNSASAIYNGDVVYISGGGNGIYKARPEITLAIANTESRSYVLGLATHDIPIGTEGLVTVNGIVNDVDTRAFIDGQILYLSSTNAGKWTPTEVTAPNHNIVLGRVIKAANSNAGGCIYVSPNIGHELNELHNVLITNPISGDVLTYNGTLWVNKPWNRLP